MKSIPIKGKNYIPVNERVKEFKQLYPNWKLLSDIVEIHEDMVIMKAEVFNESGELIGRGFAQEYRNASQINKTSMLENAETSAWGRALGNIGIGIDASMASADEVERANEKAEELKRSASPEEIKEIIDKCKEAKVAEETVSQKYGIKSLFDLNYENYKDAKLNLDYMIEQSKKEMV